MRSPSCIAELHIADGASAALDKPGGGLIDLPPLSLEGSGKVKLAQGGDKLLRLAGLALGADALLDLADNDMIVSEGDIDAIIGAIKLGRLTGTSRPCAGLAALLNNNDDGIAIKTTFAGQSVLATDVLLKYTWDGDANLDGTINADDYFLIDSG